MSNPSLAPRTASGIDRIRDLSFSFPPQRILSVGVQLDVFSIIAHGRKSSESIASICGASVRGLTMLLDALVGLELLTKSPAGYELTADSDRYLVRESPDYCGAILESDTIWETWGHLADSVRSGKPWRSASDEDRAQKFFPVLIRTLHITHREPARRLAAALAPQGSRRGLRVLDIGCGSAVWSIAIAKLDPQARVTAVDYPVVLETTLQFVAKESLLDRYEFLPRDLRIAEFPLNRYDLVLLGNVAHGEGPEQCRSLFARIHNALAGMGRLAIIDLVPNDDRTGPTLPLLFALTMLLNTDAGGTYTLAEYQNWLNEAGFAQVETLAIDSPATFIVATKTRLGGAALIT